MSVYFVIFKLNVEMVATVQSPPNKMQSGTVTLTWLGRGCTDAIASRADAHYEMEHKMQ